MSATAIAPLTRDDIDKELKQELEFRSTDAPSVIAFHWEMRAIQREMTTDEGVRATVRSPVVGATPESPSQNS